MQHLSFIFFKTDISSELFESKLSVTFPNNPLWKLGSKMTFKCYSKNIYPEMPLQVFDYNVLSFTVLKHFVSNWRMLFLYLQTTETFMHSFFFSPVLESRADVK